MKMIRLLATASVIVSVSIAAVSCGSFSSGGSGSLRGGGSGGSSGDSSGGISGDTSGSSGSGNVSGSGSMCATGTLDCNGGCINPNTDNANCGTCGHGCATDQTCQSGSCACAAGRVPCGASGACVDTNTDPMNCGGCGTTCASGEVCSAGTCTTSCGTGLTACSGACVNLQSDLDHCGNCTTACSAANGQSCTGGSCQCNAGLSSCTNGCKNLQTDSANCGACGMACGTGQTCSGGQCTCSGGQTNCSGTCRNLMTDSANCGQCGMACPAGQTCSGGMCGGGGMCDLLGAAGHPCVGAHSTVRALYSNYTGPLYQVCRGSFVAGPNSCTSGQTRDIGVIAGGYADSAAQDAFCAGGPCTISIIYDQSGHSNELRPAPAGGAKPTPDNPANATALRTTLNGHTVYGVLVTPGIGYRKLVGNGTAINDQTESMYMVSSQQNLINGCCFDYGNAETDAHDDGNGTMEAAYLGLGVVWGTGVNGGPWVMADLENGLYAGWENNQDRNISTNMPVRFDFVTAVVVGDAASANQGRGRFALYGGDSTTGTLRTMYDGIRPAKPGYVPMKKQGSIILGIGGDNSDSGGGRWYEGVMTPGAWTIATVNAVQANIVAARYGR